MTHGYDDASQLTSLLCKDEDDPTLGDLTYGYDAVGRRIGMDGTFARVTLPSAVFTTSHDAANRLMA